MTTVSKGKTVPTTKPANKPSNKPKNGRPAGERDPVFDELGFPKDPDNLYTQTVQVMLHAADLLEIPHWAKLILAQPQSEIMVHFPVRMDSGEYRLFKGY